MNGNFIGGGKGEFPSVVLPEIEPSSTALKNHITDFRFAGDEFTEGAYLLFIIKQMDNIVDRTGLNELLQEKCTCHVRRDRKAPDLISGIGGSHHRDGGGFTLM